uniref:Putative methyltransferase n=1 Tax=viral metagenome TaxID=1070528 RepID=A0A6M3KC96_9ZZZZ
MDELTIFGKKRGTDKAIEHTYTPIYHEHFKHLREQEIKLFEIGAGGYEQPNIGAMSLRMWKDYFPFGQIYSIDIYDKRKFQEDRIHIFKGSQTDELFLLTVIKSMGGAPDIIIDDGSHVNYHVIYSFEILFPFLKNGGIYVIEDCQTSYWPEYRGGSTYTTMDYFTRFVHGLNWREQIKQGYEPTYYDKWIFGIHFYHNMIFIYKGDNTEESNVLKNNQRR